MEQKIKLVCEGSHLWGCDNELKEDKSNWNLLEDINYWVCNECYLERGN